MNHPFVSIIVPVYNTEKYLSRCIQSVLAQTYTNWELLLIDDGSTDSSGAICDKYAAEDKRIRVFHKENGGVSSARNLGLDNAQGEWVSFIDADDFVAVNYLGSLRTDDDYDLVVCSFEVVGNEQWKNEIEDGEFSKHELSNFIDQYLDCAFVGAPWCKLFRKSLIDYLNLRFNTSINFNEDTLFVLQYLKEVSAIKTINERLYQYNRENTAGLSRKTCTYRNYIYTMDKLTDALCKVKKRYDFDFQKAYLNLMIGCFVRILNSMRYSGYCYNDIKTICANVHCKRVIYDKYILLKGKRRLLFDFLAKNEIYWLVAVWLKCMNPIY